MQKFFHGLSRISNMTIDNQPRSAERARMERALTLHAPAKRGKIAKLISHATEGDIRWWLILWLCVFCGCAHYKPHPLVATGTASKLQTRTLSDEGLRTFLETNRPGLAKEWPRKSWELDGLVLAAFYYHPSLELARADWDLAKAGIRTAGGRLNPSVGVDAGYDTGIANNFSPWQPAISFDVPIETAGKRHRRIEEAQHLSDLARLNIATAAWQVRSRLRNTLLDFVASRQRADLLQHQINLQQQIVDRLKLQLQAGAIGTAELTAARVALGRAIADLAGAKRQLAGSHVNLADAIGVPVSALDNLFVEFDLSHTAGADILRSANVRDSALHSRTDILAGLTEYAATQSALQLEIAKQYPDVHLSPAYLWNQGNEGDHEWQLGVTLELPVLNRNQGPIAQAEARRKVAAARFVALQAKAISEIDGAVAVYNASLSNLAALQSLAAAKREEQEVTVAQAKAGAIDKLQVLSSEFEFDIASLAELDARVQLQQALGALEDSVQRPFELPEAIYQGNPSNISQR